MSTSATFQACQEKVHKFLREKNAVTNVLEIIEAKTKVNRDYIFYGKYHAS